MWGGLLGCGRLAVGLAGKRPGEAAAGLGPASGLPHNVAWLFLDNPLDRGQKSSRIPSWTVRLPLTLVTCPKLDLVTFVLIPP